MAPEVTPDLDFFYPEPGMKLYGGQYELLRHLGSGKSSTTWLATTSLTSLARREKYYAIKILTRTATDLNKRGKANELELNRVIKYIEPCRAKDIAKMRDHFEVQGFAGPHLCLVFDCLCQDITAFRESTPSNALKPYMVKKIVFDLLNALSCLHSMKIIQGGITGDKLLFDSFCDTLAEDHLAQYPPETVGEFSLGAKKHFVYAPRPLAAPYPWDMSHYDCELIGVCLTSLGQSQWAGQTSAVEVKIPPALCPPETVIKSHFGPEVDVWAVGCLAFELLVGESLFNPVSDGDERTVERDLLAQMFAITGQQFNPLSFNTAQEQCGLLDAEGILLRSRESAVTSLEDRLASSNLLSESEVEGAAAFIRKCLQLEYSDRLAVEELAIDNWVWGWVSGGCN